MNIEISNYLSHDEIKEIVEDELRAQIRNHFSNEENARRLLSNLSYQIIFDEVDKTVTESKSVIADKTRQLLNNMTAYNVFRDDSYGGRKSLATQLMEQSVKDNAELLRDKVRETIVNKDMSEEVWTIFEKMGDEFASNIYQLVELARKKP